MPAGEFVYMPFQASERKGEGAERVVIKIFPVDKKDTHSTYNVNRETTTQIR
jgi:hypothetical protein